MNKFTYVLLFFSCIALTSLGQDKYNEAWNNDETSIIIDAFYMNELDIDKIKSDSRVVGLIHKATEGVNTVDPKFTERQKGAYKNHMLFGAYHLGTNADPKEQADLFLQTVNDNENTLLVLNLQRDADDAMTPEGAEEFITYVYESTGKYPVVHVNDKMFKDITSKYDESSVFAKCLLWYERLRKELPLESLKNSVWSDYFLWQFSSKLNCNKNGECLYNVPGTKYDIDVSVFADDRNALSYVWNTNQLDPNLSFEVTDLNGYFKSDIYCKDKSKIENIRYVEVSNSESDEIVDRYLVYENNGRTLVSRKMFKFMAQKMDAYVIDDTRTIASPETSLTHLEVENVGDVFNVTMTSYAPPKKGKSISEQAEINKKVKFMLGNMTEPGTTDAVMYDIKFECDN